MLNTGVLIQDRSGTTLTTWTSLAAFWQQSTNTGSFAQVFDPVVLFDPSENRWIASSAVDYSSTNSAVLVAVSQTANPTGNWYFRRVKADSANLRWADRPRLAFNKDWVVVSANMFGIATNTSLNTRYFVFTKSDLYSGGTTAPRTLVNTDVPGSEAPAVTYDNSLSTLYILQNVTGNYTNGGTVQGVLRLFSISGSVGAEQLNYTTSRHYLYTPNTWAYRGASDNLAPQKEATNRLHAGDHRLQSVFYRNGHLWAVHAIFTPLTNATASGIQMYKIAVSPNLEVAMTWRIEGAPATGTCYLYPSIAVNQFDDVLLGYSKCSSNVYVGAYYRFMPFYKTEFQSERIAKEGEGAYWKESNGQNRWGDYSTTVADPVNNTHFWTIQQYALPYSGTWTNGCGRWATWWAQAKMQQSSNDNFADAVELSGVLLTNTGVFLRPTKETGEPNHLTNSTLASVWFKWTAPASGSVTILVTGDTFAPGVAVYTGASVSALWPVSGGDSFSNDDGDGDHTPPGMQPRLHPLRLSTPVVTFSATAGTVYRIALVEWPDANGNYTLRLNQPSAPLITIHPFPRNPHVIQGDPVTFAAGAIGCPAPTFKWHYSGNSNTWSDISGATATTYTISSVQSTNDGYYRLYATNAHGTAVSSAAKLDYFSTGAQPITDLLSTASGFEFKQPEVQGYTYVFYASTNVAAPFSNWVAVLTNVAGTNFITDAGATNYPQRFYRSKLVQ
jgi:hypothetical protein